MMSQFENPYAGEAMTPVGETKLSGMAVAGLICSLIFCCPLVTILGPILGGAAVARIGGNPALRGRGVAIAAIVIGALTTTVSAVGWMKVRSFFMDLAAVIETMPNDAMLAGASGDYATFNDAFWTGSNLTLTDAGAAAFFTEFSQRYGAPTAVKPNEQQTGGGGFGQTTIPLAYTIDTATGQTVGATIEIVFGDETTGEIFINKMVRVTISDPANGDLVYPPASAAADPADAADHADHDHADGDHDHDHDHADGDHDHDHGDDHDHE